MTEEVVGERAKMMSRVCRMKRQAICRGEQCRYEGRQVGRARDKWWTCCLLLRSDAPAIITGGGGDGRRISSQWSGRPTVC